MRPTLLNSCAKAATAAEARFRIDAAIAARGATCIVALDEGAVDVVRRVAEHSWDGARLFIYERRPPSVVGNDKMSEVVLRPFGGPERSVSEGLADADVAVLVATAGGSADAASAMGTACTRRGIMTAALVLGGGTAARSWPWWPGTTRWLGSSTGPGWTSSR